MGAACVTHPKDQDEVTMGNMETPKPSRKDELTPTSPISLLFDVMSEELGYDASALQSYCAKLQSLWIYRVIDALNIDNDIDTWNELEIPSVLEHLIRDYLNELKNTEKFRNYAARTHTDIYVTFVSKDIRTLFAQLLKQVNDLASAKQHLVYLENALKEKYLLNTDKLKKYITKEEWLQLNVPTNLKTIICGKINLTFEAEPKQYDEIDAKHEQHTMQGEDDDEVMTSNEDTDTLKENENDDMPLIAPHSANGILPGLQNMSSVLSNKINAIRSSTIGNTEDDDHDMENDNKIDIFTDIVFDETLSINKHVNVRSNMMELAQYFSQNLFVDDVDKIYCHFRYFVEYGFYTLYHLSFISNALFDQLLFMSKAPTCARLELLELVDFVRNKFKRHKDSLYTKSIANILPFDSNLYWEKTTFDAFEMLQKDMQLDLSNECNVLMNNFYSNIWDWQFIAEEILLQLDAYQRYEIVRIRMHHIMKLCQYQYGQQNIPLLPPIWNSKYNANLLIHEIFAMDANDTNDTNNNCDKFHFDGLEWNEITRDHTKILVQYLDDNFVRKMQFLPIQHRKNVMIWDELMEKHDISPHLRFKINFYAIRGLPNSDDEWINAYIDCHFRQHSLPQWQQSMDVAVLTSNVTQMYHDIEHKVRCIENMLHYINVFNRIQINDDENKQIVEMNQMIRQTIHEIDEMGLNQEFYQIIQFCGSKALQKLQRRNEDFGYFLNDSNRIQLQQINEDKLNSLTQIKQMLNDMRKSVYSIPIHDIMALSQTVCQSVQWLQNQLSAYKTNQ